MADIGVFHNDGILNLNGVSHMDIVSQVGISTDIGVGAYVAVLSNVYISLNVDSGPDNASLIQKYFPVDVGAILYFSPDFGFELSDQFFVDFNQFPWPSDINPILVCFVSHHLFAVSNLQGNGIGNLILSTFGNLCLFNLVENVPIENVDTCIYKVAWSLFTFRFFHNAFDVSILNFNHSKSGRVLNFSQKHQSIRI